MLNWNAKSRKKLFLSKSESPEQSKHKKRCDGNLPMTRLQILDVDENGVGPSSIKPCSDYNSSSSSVVDEDICSGSQAMAPGVVARLMGLDTLPKSSVIDPHSCTPLFDARSFQDARYQTKIRGYCLGQDKDVPVGNDKGSKYQKVVQRPIEKFQDEILPPKSARSIPITHHMLMSPIKSANFTPSKDAARMMEVAARIIDPRTQVSTKTRGAESSLVPIKVRDLKERVRAAERQSQGKGESYGVKNKGLNGVAPNSDGGKSKGKSISLALLAKANVQKREGLSSNGSRSLKESHVVNPHLNLNLDPVPSQLCKDESKMQKCLVKRQSLQIRSCVLQQNNQKQNCIIDKGNSFSKYRSKEVKMKLLGGESTSSRQPSPRKVSSASKVGSRNNSCSEIKDDRGIASKKRSIDGAYHSGKSKPTRDVQKNKNGKAIQSSSWEHASEGAGTDVISFTFTSPMTRSGPDSRRAVEASGEISKISSGSQNIMSPLSSDGSRFSFPVRNVKGSDALSILLDQKLKELAHKVDLSQQRWGTILHQGEHTMSSAVIRGKTIEDNQVLQDLCTRDNKMSRAQKLLDCHLPSPVSILEHFSFGDRCSSPDSADSNSTEGGKLHSSTQTYQVLDLHSSKTLSISIEGVAELSDSASSTTTKTKAGSNRELDYMRKILCDIEPMFTNYASGISDEIISAHLFHRAGNQKGCPNNPNQRLLFDCVRECLDTRCVRYACGGFQSWAKGVSMVRRKDRLTEEVYKEISDWSAAGDCMIDDLVDRDMSSRYRKWLDYDTESFELGIRIESRVINSLIDEVIADMLFL